MKFNILEYWLSTSIKPLWYRIWRYVIMPVIFLAWVLCIGVYQEFYWKLSFYIILPVAVVDFLVNIALYFLVYKKQINS